VCLRIFSIGVISAAATPETLSFCLNIPKPFAEHSSKAAFTASCSSLRTSLCLPYPIQFLSLSQTLLLRTGKSSQWTILTSGTSSSGFYQLASQLRIALAPPKLDTSSFEREQLCLPMEYTEFTMVDSSRYQLVSSLYGPGTVVCWYLTWVSVQVSWITHPKKGTFDSIDPDFIAVLTLPTVAAGHRGIPGHHGYIHGNGSCPIPPRHKIQTHKEGGSFRSYGSVLFLCRSLYICM
jgi:hypothetical protein